MTDLVALQAIQHPAVAGGEPDDRDLEQVVVEWLLTLRSEHSRSAYATDLGLQYQRTEAGTYRLSRRNDGRGWLDYLELVGVPLLATSESLINAWRDHLNSTGLAPSTVKRRLAAVSSLYRYMVRRGLLEKNPAQYAPRPKVDPDRVVTFSPVMAELDQIVRAAEDRDHRAEAVVKVMAFTGARVSEVVDADVEDLRTARGETSLRVTRKGGEVADLPVPEPAAEALGRYLAGRTSGPLFTTGDGRRLPRSRVRDIVKAVGKRAGFPDLNPHSLRHAYANGAEALGVPVTQVQRDLGHKSLATTQRYLHASRRHKDFGGHKLAARLGKRKGRAA